MLVLTAYGVGPPLNFITTDLSVIFVKDKDRWPCGEREFSFATITFPSTVIHEGYVGPNCPVSRLFTSWASLIAPFRTAVMSLVTNFSCLPRALIGLFRPPAAAGSNITAVPASLHLP